MKKLVFAGIMAALLATSTAFAEQAYQKDIQLFSQNEIVLTNNELTKGTVTTINGAAAELGALQDVRVVYEERDHKPTNALMTHAFYEQGALWMVGEVAPDQDAAVGRMITSSPEVATAKGLKIGDDFTQVMALYGEPQYIHWNKLCKDDYLEVDRWLIYFCQEPYEKGTPKAERPEITKLLIGMKGMQVVRLGYSGMWKLGL